MELHSREAPVPVGGTVLFRLKWLKIKEYLCRWRCAESRAAAGGRHKLS